MATDVGTPIADVVTAIVLVFVLLVVCLFAIVTIIDVVRDWVHGR